jgi:hypothetical protein
MLVPVEDSYFLFCFLTCLDGTDESGFAWSPSMVFNGQILNAGHFAHPATTATGQRVIAQLSE